MYLEMKKKKCDFKVSSESCKFSNYPIFKSFFYCFNCLYHVCLISLKQVILHSKIRYSKIIVYKFSYDLS